MKVLAMNSNQLHSIGKILRAIDINCFRTLLDQFKREQSLSARERRNREWILESLSWDGMNDRKNRVDDATEDTFKSIIENNKVPLHHPHLALSFRKWLMSGQGVYHVTGRPGSGKSTLMKLIDGSDLTTELLKQWAGTGNHLVRGSFYAWRSSNTHQNQLEGLLRTLLHQILTECPELTSLIFSKKWDPKTFGVSEKKPHAIFSRRELLAVINSLLLSPDQLGDRRIFILIDGMDEFLETNEYGHSDIAELLLSWTSKSSGRIKMCLSSREENAFLNSFDVGQRLQLHLVTRDDVRALVSSRLERHNHFRTFSQKYRKRLIDKIVNQADGVFMWVVYVLREMRQDLDDGEDISAMIKEVDQFPTRLRKFYTSILDRVPEKHRDETRAIFAIVVLLAKFRLHLDMSGWLPHFAVLHECLASPNGRSEPLSLASRTSMDILAQKFVQRLATLTQGLVEPEWQRGRRPTDGTLRLTHHSLLDFLQNPSCAPSWLSRPDFRFDPAALLFRSTLWIAQRTDWLSCDGFTGKYWRETIISIWKVIPTYRPFKQLSHTDLAYMRDIDVAIYTTFRMQSEDGLDRPGRGWLDDKPMFLEAPSGATDKNPGTWFPMWKAYINWVLKPGRYPSKISGQMTWKEGVFSRLFFQTPPTRPRCVLEIIAAALESRYFTVNEYFQVPIGRPPRMEASETSLWTGFLSYTILHWPYGWPHSEDRSSDVRKWKDILVMMMELGADTRVRLYWREESRWLSMSLGNDLPTRCIPGHGLLPWTDFVRKFGPSGSASPWKMIEGLFTPTENPCATADKSTTDGESDTKVRLTDNNPGIKDASRWRTRLLSALEKGMAQAPKTIKSPVPRSK